jgi:cytochrome c oxidase subunit 2
LAESQANPIKRPLLDGIVSEEEVARTETYWAVIMLGMLATMMAIIVLTGMTNALHPPSNGETIDPTTLHLGGEFAESNLGTAVEPDGSVTARVIGEQYSFVPDCVRVPVDTPVKFRLTSADLVHGFLIPSTNINTMVVPGFIAEVRTNFTRSGEYWMPCDEFCGDGHHDMWARVNVVPKDQFPKLARTERTSCAK